MKKGACDMGKNSLLGATRRFLTFDINKLGDDKGSNRNARLKLKSLSWRVSYPSVPYGKCVYCRGPKPGMSPLGALRPPVTGGPRALFQGFLPPKACNSSSLPSSRVAPSLHFSLPASVFRCLLSCFFRRCRGASGKLQLWAENASPQIHRSRSWTTDTVPTESLPQYTGKTAVRHGPGYLQKFGEMIAGSPHDSEAEHPLPQNLEYGDPETP
ncbi:hypothetical protein QR685DRAFT_595910 [Neurospora intermedia]|uniref:Uncharacterized protein n=1 Tax=Neurospora intermedia TaxID=5142 RepID=A0ABR3DFR1_NEUIN